MFSFADKLIISMIPTLFNLLIKEHDKVEHDDEWDIPKAASNCLSLLASCCKELVVPPLIRFTDHVHWNQKEAAITAFGSILNGPSKIKMKPLIEQVSGTLFTEYANLNDTAARFYPLF